MNVPRLASAMAVLGFGCAVVAGPVFAAPCKGRQGAVVQHGNVVQHAVVHERVISSTPVVREVAMAQVPADIVDTAVGAGTFKTLAAALGAADLVATLKGDGPFTVFAPTDDAFAKLPAGTVETLLEPDNKEKLKEILLLHVVPGSVMVADVVKLKDAKTAGGKTVTISTDGGVKVGTAKR